MLLGGVCEGDPLPHSDSDHHTSGTWNWLWSPGVLVLLMVVAVVMAALVIEFSKV